MHELTLNLQEYLQGLNPLAQSLVTFLISMIPVIELRGAIPMAAYAGLPWFAALPVAVLGNMLPVPFILLFVRRVFKWLQKHTPLGGMVERLERRARGKMSTVHKYELLGLMILVAIPLPGTGAWTGALVAALMDLRLRSAIPAIALGVVIAGVVMTLLSYGIAAIFA